MKMSKLKNMALLVVGLGAVGLLYTTPSAAPSYEADEDGVGGFTAEQKGYIETALGRKASFLYTPAGSPRKCLFYKSGSSIESESLASDPLTCDNYLEGHKGYFDFEVQHSHYYSPDYDLKKRTKAAIETNHKDAKCRTTL
jgi:hypothetical protein